MSCLPSCLVQRLLDRVAGRLVGRVLGLPALWAGLVYLAPWFAPAEARALPLGSLSSPASGDPAVGDPTSGRPTRGRANKKRRKHGKLGNPPGRKVGNPTGGSMAAAHRRERRHHGPAAAQPAKVALVQSPGPAQTPEAQRAMDKVRHMQIERAEDAARREELTNRWQTVNLLISGVDERRYPAAGFWRVLSCYRLGRIDEGDSARQRYRLSPADVRTLDGERSVALLLGAKNGPPPLEAATLAATTNGFPEGSVNNAAYTGPGPNPDPAAAAP